MNVSKLAEKLNLSIATTSHHLNSLQKGSVLIAKKSGKEVHYSLSDVDMMMSFKDLICKNTKL